jgi:citrate synthase
VTSPSGADQPTDGYRTSLGASDATSITLLGRDLADDIMGQVGFGELALWLLTRRRPEPGQVRVFEAVLASLADHGFVPTAIAARLTLLSAPDSLQGAMAAGLLGGGSRFLGVTEDCGQFLAAKLAAHDGPLPTDDDGWDDLARPIVTAERAARRIIPGLGHPTHTSDPRVPRLFAIAEEEDLRGPHLRLFEAIGRVHPEIIGRTLPLNGAGVGGAALVDAGVPLSMLRGVALLARAAGLLGQLAEEMEQPVARDIYLSVHDRTAYVAPEG